MTLPKAVLNLDASSSLRSFIAYQACFVATSTCQRDLKSKGKILLARQQDLPVPEAMRGPSRGHRGAAALTSRHQPSYALMYEDNPDP